MRIFSGVQPTAEAPHIGNYIGAFKHWVDLQSTHDSFICIVDLHAITEHWEPDSLGERTRSLAAVLLACGIDAERSVLFAQSDVPAHTELTWFLTCLTGVGELGRMTQFKERAKSAGEGRVGAGLFMYPVLMAADVLAYRAELVPVGDDQRQHLELMRDIAGRFNSKFGDTFPVPEAFVPESGSRIMSLDDPSQKMSKSAQSDAGVLWLLDPPDAIASKVSKAVTDSGSEIRSGPDKPALSNLLEIYSAVTGRSVDEISAQHTGSGYADFKKSLVDGVVAFLDPIQKRYEDLQEDREELDSILGRGAERARGESEKTLELIRRKAGVGSRRAKS